MFLEREYTYTKTRKFFIAGYENEALAENAPGSVTWENATYIYKFGNVNIGNFNSWRFVFFKLTITCKKISMLT
jgi:hypothetical protein